MGEQDVVAVGRVVAGAEEEFNRSGLGQFARYEMRETRFLRADVALVWVDVRAVTEDGQPLAIDHSMVSLFVLSKEDGRWLVAARQDRIVPA